MARTAGPPPDWLRTRAIDNAGRIIDFPLINDIAFLLWNVNPGCIDVHPWHATEDTEDARFLQLYRCPRPVSAKCSNWKPGHSGSSPPNTVLRTAREPCLR